MSILWNGLGLVTAVASAAALYAASPHCHWRLPRLRSRIGGIAGMLLAASSLVLWIRPFGAAVGVSTMLTAWMLTMIALPWLSLCAKGRITGSTRST